MHELEYPFDSKALLRKRKAIKRTLLEDGTKRIEKHIAVLGGSTTNDIVDILEDSPQKIWEQTKKDSGITKEFYVKYYKNREKAIAYKLGNIKVYDKPKKLCDIGINYVPQSFVYMD